MTESGGGGGVEGTQSTAGPELSLSLPEAGGECGRMVPRLHAASVDHMPGCSLSLAAGRAASPRASVIFIFCHVIPAYWLSWDYFFFFF